MVNTNTTLANKSPSISPLLPGVTPCRRCAKFKGNPDTDNLCSSCYKECNTGPAQLCKKCQKMYGTSEKHGYCSMCYKQVIAGDFNNTNTTEQSSEWFNINSHINPNSMMTLIVNLHLLGQRQQMRTEYEIPISNSPIDQVPIYDERRSTISPNSAHDVHHINSASSHRYHPPSTNSNLPKFPTERRAIYHGKYNSYFVSLSISGIFLDDLELHS